MASIAGGHKPNKGVDNCDWLTPPEILKALGPFDLDPCAAPRMPWETARKMLTKETDGFNADWGESRVFLNPPYGLQTAPWMRKMSAHGNGIALIFARTETKLWQEWVWKRASGILFLSERLFFYDMDGQRAAHNSGGPSALVAYDRKDGSGWNPSCLSICGLSGAFVDGKDVRWCDSRTEQ